jgi:hypothetical protein
MKSPPKLASLPVTASSTIADPTKSNVLALDASSFHWCPFQVHAGATMGSPGHFSGASGMTCIGHAIAGCAAPSAGSAKGPRVSNSTRPDTGSVARVPLPKTTNGVELDAFDHSLPFQSHVTALGEPMVPQSGGTIGTVRPGFAVPLGIGVALGAGAMAGIGLPGGMTVAVDPDEPEDDPDDDDPEPPKQPTGPWFDPSIC